MAAGGVEAMAMLVVLRTMAKSDYQPQMARVMAPVPADTPRTPRYTSARLVLTARIPTTTTPASLVLVASMATGTGIPVVMADPGPVVRFTAMSPMPKSVPGSGSEVMLLAEVEL